ncbi:hypothetical protein AAW01_05490 [Aurantiacibacter gangjinensis]|uniref:Uncharacterized protein n=2 Tax=Aurantiacibacter gangjinensis TaxID=502682 RepID=A0A0G9MS49_9SPHN|nr:hypothetical protein AAW01_05490 [Aurantiacibacter gangjinensis]
MLVRTNKPMPKTPVLLAEPASSIRRPTARVDKRAAVINGVIFIVAIIVVLFFLLGGIGGSDADRPDSLAVTAETDAADASSDALFDPVPMAAAEDDYVVGSFGDPVADLYLDDAGGWGSSALDDMRSETAREAEEAATPSGTISRGRGARRN